MSKRLWRIAASVLTSVCGLAWNPWACGQEAGNASRSAMAVVEEQPAGTKPNIGEASTEQNRIVERNPRVLFIVEKGSERCRTELERLRRPGGDFAAMQARGWKIGPGPENHLQVVDGEAIPELIEQLKIFQYPTVACVDQGEIVRSFQHGCTTPLDAWTFGWLLKGKDERPGAVVPEKVQVAWTGNYRLRGNHWSIEGDFAPRKEVVVAHLRSPNHNYGVAANWKIETWSYEELRSLHDDLHDREMASRPQSYGTSSRSGAQGSSPFSASHKFSGR